MSLFDFLFPEQSQASSLRQLAQQGNARAFREHRQRLAAVQTARVESEKSKNLEQRLQTLERELAQAGLAIEALLELLEERGGLTREDFAARLREIDLRDGVEDGQQSPQAARPPVPARPWPGS